MTIPQPSAPPPLDPGNALLAETGAQLSTALVQTPAGQRMVLTVRTSSATLSVFLQAGDAKTWAAQISKVAGQMSTAGLIIANGHPG
jgi:hypothetical protein